MECRSTQLRQASVENGQQTRQLHTDRTTGSSNLFRLALPPLPALVRPSAGKRSLACLHELRALRVVASRILLYDVIEDLSQDRRADSPGALAPRVAQMLHPWIVAGRPAVHVLVTQKAHDIVWRRGRGPKEEASLCKLRCRVMVSSCHIKSAFREVALENAYVVRQERPVRPLDRPSSLESSILRLGEGGKTLLKGKVPLGNGCERHGGYSGLSKLCCDRRNRFSPSTLGSCPALD